MSVYTHIPSTNLIVATENFAPRGVDVELVSNGRLFVFAKPNAMPKDSREVDVAQTSEKIRTVKDYINGGFIGKGYYLDVLTNTYVSRENFLTYGVPGTAKTAINTVFMSAFTGQGFDYTLTADTSDNDLFGPKDSKVYAEESKWVRNPAGVMVSEKLFLDEIGKATKRVYTMLMQALENWKISDGANGSVCIPTHSCVAASNEDLSAAMEGLDRRFSFRYEMNEISSAEQMKLALASVGKNIVVPDNMIVDLSEVSLMAGLCEYQARNMADESLIDFYLSIWQELESQGFHVDNGTVIKSLKMVFANALWRGEAVENKHCSVLADIFWRQRKDSSAVRDLVLSKTDPDQQVMIRLRKMASDMIGRFTALESADNRGNNPDFNNAITDFRVDTTETMSDMNDALPVIQSATYKAEVNELISKLGDKKDEANRLNL